MNNDETEKRLCSTCGKEATLKCSRCLYVVYCNSQCQSSDWKEHKKNCFPEGSTCTRCLQVIDRNTKCTVPHPAHMLQDQGSTVDRGSYSWKFSCNACKGSFVKTSSDSDGMATAPITTGAPFCYVGPHTINPLPAENLRRSEDLRRSYMQSVTNALSAIPGRKIVTWTAEPMRGNFDMEDDILLTTTWEQLASMWKPLKTKNGFVTMIVRQFTDRYDESTRLPIKVIRGFIATKDEVIQLSPDDVKMCQEHDPRTGAFIGEEAGVEYA